MGARARRAARSVDPARASHDRHRRSEGDVMTAEPTNLPRVTYSNTGEDFSGVHAHLDEIISEAENRLLGKSRPAFVGGRDRLEGQTVAARSPIDRGIVLGEFPQADA